MALTFPSRRIFGTQNLFFPTNLLPVAPGSIAFIGPHQLSTLTEFQYVANLRVEDDDTTVQTTGPDGPDMPPEVSLAVSVLRCRSVADSERLMWPSSFVGYPIAFFQLDGDDVHLWASGILAGYTMSHTADVLHVIGNAGAI